MQRSILKSVESESVLLRLCRDHQWAAATARCRSHPWEVMPNHASLGGEGTGVSANNNTLLARLVRDRATAYHNPASSSSSPSTTSPPLELFQAVIQVNAHQVAITHPIHGSILHLALQSSTSVRDGDEDDDPLIELLIDKVIQYQQQPTNNDHDLALRPLARRNISLPETATASIAATSFFRHVCVQDQSIVAISDHRKQQQQSQLEQQYVPDVNLLAVQDYLGRTALHLLVERMRRWRMSTHQPHITNHNDFHPSPSLTGRSFPGSSSSPSWSWSAFTKLLHAYPEAMLMLDVDGHTPFTLLLSTPPPTPPVLMSMIQYTVAIIPEAACVPARSNGVNIPTLPTIVSSIASAAPSMLVDSPSSSLSCSTTAVYYAILYGHSIETIELLLQTKKLLVASVPTHDTKKRKSSSSSRANERVATTATPPPIPIARQFSWCSIVTGQSEVLLHVAVTVPVWSRSTSSTTAIIKAVLEDDPTAACVPDLYGLTPLDWLYIRYILDCGFYWGRNSASQRRGGGGDNNNRDDDDDDDDNRRLPHQLHRRSLGEDQPWSTHIISRRRYIPSQYLHWNEAITAAHASSRNHHHHHHEQQILDHHLEQEQEQSSPWVAVATASPDTATDPPMIDPEIFCDLQEGLLQRMKLLLPTAAAIATNGNHTKCQRGNGNDQEEEEDHNNASDGSEGLSTDQSISKHGDDDDGGDWTLLHAVCAVPCPLGMLRIALGHVDTRKNDVVRQRDTAHGRLPLHYAAERLGYTVQIPLGITHRITTIQEESPVRDLIQAYPGACSMRDGYGQLPLHIVIDAYQRHRVSSCMSNMNVLLADQDKVDQAEYHTLQLLLRYDLTGLERRDGISWLYPWQQAAIGPGASLNTIFTLLQMEPTLSSIGRKSYVPPRS